MRSPHHAIAMGVAILALGPGACQSPQAEQPSPLVMGEFIVPAEGITADSVRALNGAPQHRERVDDRVLWVYARSIPEGAGLRSRTATVWFRDGVVVRTDVQEGFTVPTPTVPVSHQDSTGADARAGGSDSR